MFSPYFQGRTGRGDMGYWVAVKHSSQSTTSRFDRALRRPQQYFSFLATRATVESDGEGETEAAPPLLKRAKTC